MVEWGLAGIDGLHDPDGTWPWWGRPPPRVELQPPQFVEVWIAHDAKDRGAEPDWPDLAVRTAGSFSAMQSDADGVCCQPLSATFAREPGGSAAPAAAKPAVDEQPVRPVVVPDTRPRLRQWLSFSTGPAHNPMPVSPITAPAPDPIQSVQVGFLLAMPSPPRPETSASPPELQEMNGLVMGYAQAPWEGDSGQKLSNT